MKKLYCDVCGKEIIPVPIKVMDIKECDYSIYRNDKYGKHLLDLCNKCSTNLLKMLKDQRENDKVVYVDTDSIKVEGGKDVQ